MEWIHLIICAWALRNCRMVSLTSMISTQQARGPTKGQGGGLLRAEEACPKAALRGEEGCQGGRQDGEDSRVVRLLKKKKKKRKNPVLFLFFVCNGLTPPSKRSFTLVFLNPRSPLSVFIRLAWQGLRDCLHFCRWQKKGWWFRRRKRICFFVKTHCSQPPHPGPGAVPDAIAKI